MAETTAQKKPTARKKTTTAKRVRKAPTNNPTPTARAGVSSGVMFAASLFAAFVVISGVSFFIGTSDKGAIDVTGVINERASAEEAKGNSEESQAIRDIGKQNTTNDLPNGGLVGAGNRDTRQQEIQEQQKEEQEVASSTATSSEALASSTPEVEEVVQEDSEEERDQNSLEEGLLPEESESVQ